MIAPVMMSLIAALAQAGPATPPSGQPGIERRAVATAHLDIPDEIAPAVVPYLGCLIARDGTEVRGSHDPRPRGVGRGADCGPHREAAHRRADSILVRIGGRSADERHAFVERTLTSIEAFHRAAQARRAAAEHHDHAED